MIEYNYAIYRTLLHKHDPTTSQDNISNSHSYEITITKLLLSITSDLDFSITNVKIDRILCI